MKSLNFIYLAKICTHKTEADIAVLVVRIVVVTIRGPQVPRVVVPATATNNAIGPRVNHSPKKHFLP